MSQPIVTRLTRDLGNEICITSSKENKTKITKLKVQ